MAARGNTPGMELRLVSASWPPEIIVVLFELPIGSESEFAELLRRGGFDVAPMNDEPWATDRVSWHPLLCHRAGAVVVASIAIDHHGEMEPLAGVDTCRKFLWFWTRRRDVQLADDVAAHLVKCGAKPCTARDS